MDHDGCMMAGGFPGNCLTFCWNTPWRWTTPGFPEEKKTMKKMMDEDLNYEAFRVWEHMEPQQKAKIPFCTCWSAWWHSWWVLHADLCFSAPWSVRCPPRLFEQTLCRHTTKRRSRHRRRVRISASAATTALLRNSYDTRGLSEWRPVLKVLKVWFPFLRSSCRKLVTSCWSYRHSAFFCFRAASPSWMFCSKAVSLLSLCSWLSWPNSLLVIPFREKTRTVCAHTHTHRYTATHTWIHCAEPSQMNSWLLLIVWCVSHGRITPVTSSSFCCFL